jgi:alcohol dehydrogenase class IV
MRRHGVLDRLLDSLRAADVRATVYDQVSPDPKSDEVDAALELATRDSCRSVIGLGGGSALDAAKAVAVAVGHESVRELIGQTLEPSSSSLPVIAIPTTAGSGAEVTKGSIITDSVRNFKSGIRGDDVFPAVALVDPELTETMPAPVAAETGFDALTHAIEGYVARRAGPISQVLSETAVTLIAANLRDAANGAVDPEVRDRMSLAAVYGGLNVATASTCLPHRLQQAMGSVTRVHVPHGRGLATLYPAWLRRAFPSAPDRFDRLAELLGASSIDEGVGELRESLGLDKSLGDWGYTSEDIGTFMDNVSGNVDNDPIDGIDRDLMRAIYEDSL